MTRIAYICADSGVPVFGTKGCSVHVQEVVRALRDRGAVIDLFAARLGGAAPDALRDVRVHSLPRHEGRDAAERERVSIRANEALRAALEKAGPFDLVYERQSLWSFAGIEYGRSTGVPTLLEINAPLVEEQARHRTLVHHEEAERIARRNLESATALLPVSEELATRLRADGAAGSPVHVVGNGVDVDRFAPRPGPAATTAPVIGFIGSLKPWHGVETLVEAFAGVARREPASRLQIVGEGPERPRLQRMIDEHGLGDRATLTGAVPPCDVPARLLEMDIAVAPYPAIEGFYFAPLKVYEYMAAGRAIVASAIGTVERILEHERTALLYEPGRRESLEAALQTLCAAPGLRTSLGSAARATALARHSWSAIAARILEIGAGVTGFPGREVATR